MEITQEKITKIVNFIIKDTEKNPSKWHHPSEIDGDKIHEMHRNGIDVGLSHYDGQMIVTAGKDAYGGNGVAWFYNNKPEYLPLLGCLKIIQGYIVDNRNKTRRADLERVLSDIS